MQKNFAFIPPSGSSNKRGALTLSGLKKGNDDKNFWKEMGEPLGLVLYGFEKRESAQFHDPRSSRTLILTKRHADLINAHVEQCANDIDQEPEPKRVLKAAGKPAKAKSKATNGSKRKAPVPKPGGSRKRKR